MAQPTLEETPTWSVSIVTLLLFILSLLIEAGLSFLTKVMKRSKRKSLNRALLKIKTELMQMGFISLLLTIAEDYISRICVTRDVGDSFLPCSGSRSVAGAGEGDDQNSCAAEGMVPFMTREGIRQLHVFIVVLAVFHVLYCVLTMGLGTAKMKRWEKWEAETRSLRYQIENDSRRFQLTHETPFGKRHLKSWGSNCYLFWPVAFIRQFAGSITRYDYFTLRKGFIVAHLTDGTNFNFQKFLSRAFDDDFKVVVEIRFWIWILSILFILFSAHGFYSYFWLPFIPLVMALVVGMKLQAVISLMCLESQSKQAIVKGTLLVKPNDNFFWFDQPRFLLHLIHFILFQNSFQLAFFCWTWYEFGIKSCFHRKTEDIALRITMGVFVQLLCSHVTLPLYVLVSQMGSSMKKSVLTERVSNGLKHWHALAQQNLTNKKTDPSSESSISRTGIAPFSDMQEQLLMEDDSFPRTTMIIPNKITEDDISSNTHHMKASESERTPGEISFGTSWKETGSGRKFQEITASSDATSESMRL